MHFLCNYLKISRSNFHFFLSFLGETRDFMFFSSFSGSYTYARDIIIRNGCAIARRNARKTAQNA